MQNKDPLHRTYETYKADVKRDIEDCLQAFACQPILFVGSGLSKRYFGGPNWEELLTRLAHDCPLIDKDYAYYKQTYATPMEIGEVFAKHYQEWAWTSGKNEFPKELFSGEILPQVYLKYKVAEYLRSISPQNLAGVAGAAYVEEIKKLQEIGPHSIITTNYDCMLEVIFPDFYPIIGQQILKGENFVVGEIFKIHGCTSQPETIVLTEDDYRVFTRKKKYLSAKLLTYFSEHPLLFIGYSAEDPNIKSILSDIDEALLGGGGMIPNIYVIEWSKEISPDDYPGRERLIEIEGAKAVRVKAIVASDFSWIFEAFGAKHAMSGISPKLLRALLGRSYQLVRHDIPRKTFEVDFQFLQHAVGSQDEFAKLFGLTTVAPGTLNSALYPYTLTEVGKKLGGKGWHLGHQAIDKIKSDKGIDIKSSDNKYCSKTNYGKSDFRKYSEDAVILFKSVLDGQPYDLDLSPSPQPAVGNNSTSTAKLAAC